MPANRSTTDVCSALWVSMLFSTSGTKNPAVYALPEGGGILVTRLAHAQARTTSQPVLVNTRTISDESFRLTSLMMYTKKSDDSDWKYKISSVSARFLQVGKGVLSMQEDHSHITEHGLTGKETHHMFYFDQFLCYKLDRLIHVAENSTR